MVGTKVAAAGGLFQRGQGLTKDVGEWIRYHLPVALSGWADDSDAPEPARSENHSRPKTAHLAVSASISKVFDAKLAILNEAIEEISAGQREREKLNETFEKQIDGEIAECQDLLGRLPHPWSEGFYPVVESLRVTLHKSLLTRRKDKRTEQLAFWDDVTMLLEKKRDLLMEYQNLIATKSSLEGP